MQLKDLAKVSEVTSIIKKTFNNFSNIPDGNLAKNKVIIEALAKSTKGYSNEVLIAAINQRVFTESQARQILQTTALNAEQIEATLSTASLSASQATTTTTTLGLGTAFQGLGIKIQKATASMWSFLTTNPLGWATLAASTIAALAFGVKKYNDAIEEAKESARERTNELLSEFNQMNDTLSDHKKTVSELAVRYTELSKGVNLSNNKNVSLSTGEYEEFLNINSQLAKAFPELAKGIDENGNSILTLGTKGISAKEQLEELLQTEEDLNNFRVAQGLEEAFKGVYTYVEDANKATETLNGSISDSSEAMGKLQKIAENGISLTGESGQLIFSGNIQNEAELNYMNSLTDSVNEFWKSLDGSRRVELAGFGIDNSTLFRTDLNDDTGIFEIYANTFQLTSDEITALQNIIQDNVGDASSALLDSTSDRSQELQQQIKKSENAWTDFIPTLISGMKSKQTFKNLDTDLQDIAIQIVEGLDYSYADAMKEWDPDPYAYVRDNIIDPLSKLDDSERETLISNFDELFKLDAGDLSQDNQAEITKFITAIAALLEKDPLEIRVALGFDVSDDVKKRLQNSIRQITDDHGLSDRKQYSTLTEYTKNFTAEQAELWLDVNKGAKNATEAIDLYESKLAEEPQIENHIAPLSITETVNQINTQLKPAFDSLKSAYQNIFSIDEDTDEQLFSLKDVNLETFESIREELEKLDGIDGINVDYSAFENFVSVLSDTSSTADEVQQQFDHLATSIIYTTDCTNMSAETYDLLIQSLTEMGVTNAEEVLTNLKAIQEELVQAGYNLSDITLDEAVRLIELGQVSLETAEYLKLYMIQKALAQNPLNTISDILELEQLCNSLGVTAEMLGYVDALKRAFNAQELGAAGIEPTIANLKAKIAGLVNGQGQFKFNFSAPKTANSGSGSKSKTREEKDTTKEYDWIEQAIENVEKEIKELDEVADSSYSTLSRKNKALTAQIGKVTEEIELQQKAYEEYMQKADSIGLPDSYKELVQNGAVNIEDIKDEKLQDQIDEYQKWYEKAQKASDAIKELKTDLKDLHVESYKLQTENLKDRLDSDSITEKQYLAELKSAYEQFYGNLEDYAEQYHEAKLEYLEQEKKYLNSVANAAASLLDTEIDRIQENADEQEELLKGQIELLETRKKPLQDELEALDDKVRKEELALNLQKAQYDLARAENQRTKLVYTADRGMIYTSDSQAVRDARKGLDDAKSEIHKQSIQDQIDVLDDEINRYDDLIDQINKAADAQVKALEKIKRKWQEVIDEQEYAENVTILTGEFGADAVTKILTGNDGGLLAKWKNSYLDTLKSIDLESQGYIGEMTKQIESLYRNSADALSDVVGKAADTANAPAAQNGINTLDKPIVTADGTVLRPLQPGDPGYDLLLKVKPLTDKIMSGELEIITNAVFEGQRQMENWVKTINYSNIVNRVAHNQNIQPRVSIGDIYVTCPGVTEQQVAEQLGNVIGAELDRQFNGFHNYADQMSRIR